VGKILFSLLLLAGLGGGAAYLVSQAVGMSNAKETTGVLTHTVEQGRLLVQVTEDGNVESASNVDVKCQVAGGGMILWIIPDGTEVQQGDELVRLDESTITDQLNAQKILFEKALAAKIQADEDYAAAVISVREYKEGTYNIELQNFEAQITIAMENLRSSQNLLEHTERMSRKGFATPLQLEADQFSVERAKLELKSAELAKRVLVEFTREKTLKDLEAQREAAAARMRSEQAALDQEKARLDKLQDQLKHCVITAPQNGMVVYANDQSRSRYSSQQSSQVEEGAMVRDRQTLVRLPDLSNMQVKVTVHETKIEQIRPGLPARVLIQGREFQGRVLSIANQPEPGSWFSANVKEYATIVKIDGETSGLRPGMTAEVRILVADIPDALLVPVSAVVEQGSKFYCWVQTPNGPERRPLLLGQASEKMIEILDGVKAGDRVLLNPRAVVAAAREQVAPPEETDVEKKFGVPGLNDIDDAQPSRGPAGGGERGSGRPGADRDASPGTGPSGPQTGGVGAPAGRGGGMNLMQFDKDGDGKVSREEIQDAPERLQDAFDRIDTNGDGYLDASEIAAAQRRRAERERSGDGNAAPGADGGQR
jgi:HlyD family secretion protein